MGTLIVRELTRKIAGRTIPCTEMRDGIQRREWVGASFEGEAIFGSIYKSRWNAEVSAYAPDGSEKHFARVTDRDTLTTEQAFAAARRWLVGRTEGAHNEP